MTREACDHCAATARRCTWKRARSRPTCCCGFSSDVERDNLFVNFDPANMILYGAGEPIAGAANARPLRAQRPLQGRDVVGPTRRRRGAREVPLGEGDVDFPAYLRTLAEIGYDGPLTIEREIPQEPARQKAEIARRFRCWSGCKREIHVRRSRA